MRTATITEAKNRLSALIDRVRAGETILILDRGVPVARLEPAARHAADPAGRIARLERSGQLRPARRPLSPEIAATDGAEPRRGGSVLEALLAERREGR